MDLFPVSWSGADCDDQYLITVHGKTPEGRTAAVHIEWFPYFFVEVPASWNDGRVKLFVAELAARHGALTRYSAPVTKKTLWGFTNGAPKRMVQLAFATLAKARAAARFLKHANAVYESGVDPLLRFFHLRDIAPASWITVHAAPVARKTTRAAIEARCQFGRVGPSTRTDRAPLVFASWDLEVMSKLRRFPKASNPADCVIQAAVSYQRYGEPEPYATRVFCYKDTAPVPGVDVRSFDTEHDMLNAFFDDLGREGADCLVTYNGAQFDCGYILGRAEVLVDDDTGESLVRLGRLGRAVDGGGKAKSWKLASNAFGDNSFETFETPGVQHIDVLQVLRRTTKHDSYKLNDMAKAYLGDAKIDLPAHEIFDRFEGDARDRAVIAEYAAKDTDLPLKLMRKLCMFEDLLEMANATYCPVDYIQNRGQQIRVFSVLMRKARQLGFACPDGAGIGADGKFTGATVLSAQVGAFFEPVSVFDFASLYPSILRSRRMSYDTFVLDARYDNVPGVEYYRLSVNGKDYAFAQTADAVVPSLLAELAEFRKRAKRDMADAKARGDAFAESLFNAKQASFKVTMNSCYGFLGATKGMLPCVPIAESVTATGRQMIEQTKRLIETLVPGSRVVYGDTDSCMAILALGTDDLRAHFAKAAELADAISKEFPPPVALEFEKVFLPMVLYSKKRYAGLKYTDPGKADYIDIKGLQLVRRDSPPVVKAVMTQILDKIMHERSAERALDLARECVLRVLRGECPLDDFVVSKALRSDYKNQSQPHLTVARKIRERTGQHVPSGSRVKYVFVEDPGKAADLLAERAEDPEYAREHGLVVDRVYYVRNQLESPIVALLEPVTPSPSADVFEHPDVAPLLAELEAKASGVLKEAKRVKKNAAAGLRDITNWYKPEAR